MRTLAVAASAAALIAGGLGLAWAQTAGNAPATASSDRITLLTCADLKGADAARQTALVYFAAGYQQGTIDALAGATGGNVAAEISSASVDASIAASASAAASAAPLGSASASTALGGVTVRDPSLQQLQSSADASASSALDAATGSQSSQSVIGGLRLDAQTVLDACSGAPNARLIDLIAANGGPASTGMAAGAAVSGGTVTSPAVSGVSLPPADAGASAAVSGDLNAVSQQLNNSAVSASQNPANPAPAPAASSP